VSPEEFDALKDGDYVVHTRNGANGEVRIIDERPCMVYDSSEFDTDLEEAATISNFCRTCGSELIDDSAENEERNREIASGSLIYESQCERRGLFY